MNVTIEMPYDDALRLWVLVHDPTHYEKHHADERICTSVADAIKATESGRTHETAPEGCEGIALSLWMTGANETDVRHVMRLQAERVEA